MIGRCLLAGVVVAASMGAPASAVRTGHWNFPGPSVMVQAELYLGPHRLDTYFFLVARRDPVHPGRLHMATVTCLDDTASDCSLSGLAAPGVLDVSPDGATVRLRVDTPSGLVDLHGTTAPAQVLLRDCSAYIGHFSHGARLTATSHATVTWRGTVGGRPMRNPNCNLLNDTGLISVTFPA